MLRQHLTTGRKRNEFCATGDAARWYPLDNRLIIFAYLVGAARFELATPVPQTRALTGIIRHGARVQ
jgi:hypothetical protein